MIRALEGAFGQLDWTGSLARPWASATFDGALHTLELSGGDARLAEVGELELPLQGGHFVASIAAERIEGGWRIEALTIVDAAHALARPGRTAQSAPMPLPQPIEA